MGVGKGRSSHQQEERMVNLWNTYLQWIRWCNLFGERRPAKNGSTRHCLVADDAIIKLDCDREINGYLEAGGELIMDNKGNYINPLKW